MVFVQFGPQTDPCEEIMMVLRTWVKLLVTFPLNRTYSLVCFYCFHFFLFFAVCAVFCCFYWFDFVRLLTFDCFLIVCGAFECSVKQFGASGWNVLYKCIGFTAAAAQLKKKSSYVQRAAERAPRRQKVWIIDESMTTAADARGLLNELSGR